MKAKTTPVSTKPLEYVRTCLFFTGCVLAIVGVCVIPKDILTEPQLYSSAVSMAEVSEESMVLFEYKVYGTQERMTKGLETDLPGKIAQFKANDDILAVKVPGESFSYETFAEYILVHSQNVPELNIEYCVVKNVNAFGSSLPTRSFLAVARELLARATVIYLCIACLIAFLLFLPCGIFGMKALLRLIRLYQSAPEKEDVAEETKAEGSKDP